MEPGPTALAAIAAETRSLLDRVCRIEPFALQVPMVVAAGPSFDAQIAIEKYLHRQRQALKSKIRRFIGWLQSPAGQGCTPADAQRKFVLLRLTFKRNDDVLGERSFALVQGPLPPGARASFSQTLDDPPSGTTDIVPMVE